MTVNRITRVGEPATGIEREYTSPDGVTWRPGIRRRPDNGLGYSASGLFGSGCRITPDMGNAVVVGAGVLASTEMYLTPYKSRLVPLWDGEGFSLFDIGTVDIINDLADAVYNPAACAAASVYDLFAWFDQTTSPGTVRLSRGVVWPTTHSRAGGTTLAMAGGYLTNEVAIFNGPAAYEGLYVGTFMTDAGGATVTILQGGPAAGGDPAWLGVWNMYNRVDVSAMVVDTTAGWAYTLAAIRQANGSVNNRIDFVNGLHEDGIEAWLKGSLTTVAAAGAYGDIGIGYDQIAAYDSDPARVTSGAGVIETGSAFTKYAMPYAGYGARYFAALEGGDAANANTFGANGLNSLGMKFRM